MPQIRYIYNVLKSGGIFTPQKNNLKKVKFLLDRFLKL